MRVPYGTFYRYQELVPSTIPGMTARLEPYYYYYYYYNTETKLGKDKKKNLRGYTEVETFTTITHRKENINKPGRAK